MNFKRIGRILVCLLLICCLTFHAMIPRAEATGLEAAIPAAGSLIVTPAGVVIGATLVALGLYAAADPDGFENIKNAATDALEAAGTWIKDGTVELLRMVDELGNASYYVDSGLMEDVRSWVWDSQNVFLGPVNMPSGLASNVVAAWEYAAAQPYAACWYINSEIHIASSVYPLVTYVEDGDTYIKADGGYRDMHVWRPSGAVWAISSVISGCSGFTYFGTTVEVPCSELDVSLGSFPSQSTNLTDGTSAREWSEDYASKALMVDISGDDGGDYNLYFPMTLYPALEQLLASTQEDQWAGAASPGFTDYEVKEEYVIEELPIVDGYQGVIVSPSDIQSGTQSGTTTGAVTLPGWVQDGFNNLKDGLNDLLDSLKNLPSALWALIPAWIQEGLSNMVVGLRDILDAIKALPSSIAEAMADVITGALTKAFAISDTFIATKVEALTLKYPYLDTFLALGADLKTFFLGLGSKPPVIYIDLGASEGSYNIGGQVIFVDLTWYSRYKPTMDTIISAFLWLWFAWRLYLSLPGLIAGTNGMWGQKDNDIGTHTIDVPRRLNSGADIPRLGTSEYHGRGTSGKHYTKHEGL